MEAHEHLPDRNRMSVVIAAVMLAYAVTPFVQIAPAYFAKRSCRGLFLSFTIDFFHSLFSAGRRALAATGFVGGFLLGSSPYTPTWAKTAGRHWLLPAPDRLG